MTTPKTTHGAPLRYRTIDLVVVVMLGVAFGVAFFGYSKIYLLLDPVTSAFKPLEGLLTGFWCMPALVALLIVRKPGAAIGAEVIAATLEALLGSHFGPAVLVAGVLQGLGFELAFLLARFAKVTWPVIVSGALLSVTFEWIFEIIAYYPQWSLEFKLAYLGFFWLSGLLLLAFLGTLLVKALAATGALNSFAPGREHFAKLHAK
ncbi:MAG: ECF transporter S component [Microbacteriaceae bacterium]|nr:ECF transporter S component [Microbacteriaceae bacterium]